MDANAHLQALVCIVVCQAFEHSNFACWSTTPPSASSHSCCIFSASPRMLTPTCVSSWIFLIFVRSCNHQSEVAGQQKTQIHLQAGKMERHHPQDVERSTLRQQWNKRVLPCVLLAEGGMRSPACATLRGRWDCSRTRSPGVRPDAIAVCVAHCISVSAPSGAAGTAAGRAALG